MDMSTKSVDLGVLPRKTVELISAAYAPGMRRHIKAALRHGATIAEIIEVLNLCVVQGVQAFNLGGPILAKEPVVRSDSALIDGSSFLRPPVHPARASPCSLSRCHEESVNLSHLRRPAV
jgi:hypothetical protein